jgi:hypothetical protein
MIIPAVMFIEMAMDMLKVREPIMIEGELREFRALGPARLSEIRMRLESYASAENPDIIMASGYLLGLETARALLATNAKAIQAGVSL